jgi:type II secretory ATPase GspE/PulE/Tfp pilus assembly ATPase PilB-like protein
MANSGTPVEPPSDDFSSGQGHNSKSGQAHFDEDQMMSLVDSVLPFEACLYYQVLPLSIDATHLNLGIVNLEDTAAQDYVRRQLAFINYSLVTWPIPSDWHRQMLSKYLSHKAKTKSTASQPIPASSGVDASAQSSSSHPLTPAEEATFVVDSPTSIPQDPQPAKAVSPARDRRPSSSPKLPLSPVTSGQSQPRAMSTRSASATSPPADQTRAGASQPLALNLPDSRPMGLAAMGKLPPKALTQALLARVLRDGIGRLYFERGETTGRILWSKDGIVQAALEDLSLPLFQSVINELKRLTHLPMVNTRKSRQVEIERTYRQERVVLRFRLIASDHGEEATLQVLRGAALKFYQQQQIDQLGRDALNFAHRLQGQIDQIRDRARQTFTLEGIPETTLTTISHLLRDIDTEINQLINQHQKR